MARADWEDSFAFSEVTGALAVADGATFASQSRLWARGLASDFVQRRPGMEPPAIQRWAAELAESFAGHVDEHRTDSWWGDVTMQRGAAAALVGVQFDLSDDRLPWSAIAIGDCCLFHFTATGPALSFPLTTVGEFGSRPDLVTSTETLGLDQIHVAIGTASPGDLLVLASDAIATWIVRSLDDPTLPRLLAGIRSDNFGSLVERLRTENLMPDDDVVLLRCVISDVGRPR